MKKRQRGVAIMEFAIVLPLMLAICFAITEFGRAIYTYNTLTKSARSAVRYLSFQNAGDASAWTAARNITVFGNPAGTGSPLVPGLNASNMASKVTFCDASLCAANLSQGTNPTINTVTVTITGYQFHPILDLLGFTRFYTGDAAAITAIPFGDIRATMRQAS